MHATRFFTFLAATATIAMALPIPENTDTAVAYKPSDSDNSNIDLGDSKWAVVLYKARGIEASAEEKRAVTN